MTAGVSAVAVALAIVTSGRTGRTRLSLRTTAAPSRKPFLLFGLAVPATVAMVALGPVTILATSLLVGVLLWRRRARGAPPVGAAGIALMLDVLAGCLSAGASMPAALAAARAAAPAQLREPLEVAAEALRRGEDPPQTWLRLGQVAPELAAVSALCSRAMTSGASVTGELHRIAAALRSSLDTERRRKMQRASVWLVLPLGLCFLPAFVLVGVVPLVTATLPTALLGH